MKHCLACSVYIVFSARNMNKKSPNKILLIIKEAQIIFKWEVTYVCSISCEVHVCWVGWSYIILIIITLSHHLIAGNKHRWIALLMLSITASPKLKKENARHWDGGSAILSCAAIIMEEEHSDQNGSIYKCIHKKVFWWHI